LELKYEKLWQNENIKLIKLPRWPNG